MRMGEAYSEMRAQQQLEGEASYWEDVKYYFADFVRKGGGIPPKSVTPFLLRKKNP